MPVVSRARRAQRAAPLPADRPGAAPRARPRAGRESARRSIGWRTRWGGSSTSARRSGSGPGCLTYFRAEYPDDKAARILYAANDIAWDYVPSEFAAYLGELRQIRRIPPAFQLSRQRDPPVGAHQDLRRAGTRGSMPARTVAREDARCYGPFGSMARTLEAVRTLNDLLGLRDCAATMPPSSPGRGTCSTQPRQAGCMRHEFGFCSGPCAGFVSQADYRRRVETAAAFLEGRTIQPIDRVVQAMQEAAGESALRGGGALEGEVRAARMAARGHQPGPLRPGSPDLRVSDPGEFGDDRVYLVRQGVVRAVVSLPLHADRARGVSGRRGGGGGSADAADGSAAARVARRDSAADVLVPGPPGGLAADDAVLPMVLPEPGHRPPDTLSRPHGRTSPSDPSQPSLSATGLRACIFWHRVCLTSPVALWAQPLTRYRGRSMYQRLLAGAVAGLALTTPLAAQRAPAHRSASPPTPAT